MADTELKINVTTKADTTGLEDVKKSLFSLGDAFKFAGAEEALHALLEAAKETGAGIADVIKGAVEKAAEQQTEAFPITQLLGNAEKAKEIIIGIDSLWQDFGVVSSEALSNAARNLIILGTSAENLIPRLVEMAKVSVDTGVSIDDVVSAYQRMRFAIENGTEPMVRGMGGFGAATVEILKALQTELGKTQPEILSMFRNGQISAENLNKALRDAADAGGIFANAIVAKKDTFEGAVKSMQTAYQEFEIQLGQPIIDFATPLINEITKVERGLAAIAEKQGWQVAVQVAWTIVMDELARISTTLLVDVFTKLGPAIAEAMWAGFTSKLSTLNQTLTVSMLGGIVPQFNLHLKNLLAFSTGPVDMKAFGEKLSQSLLSGLKIDSDKAKKMLAEALKSIQPPDILPPETPETLDKVTKSADVLSEAIRKLDTELQSVRQQQQLIQQNPAFTADEKQLLLLQSYTKEVANLHAQIQTLQSLRDAGILSAPQLAEVNQKLQQAGFQMDSLKLKTQGLKLPFTTDLQNWANSFGSTTDQVFTTFKSTVDTAFGALNQWLVTGKFNLQSFLQSIELIGLKLLEQLAIQEIISLIGGAASVAQAKAIGPQIAAAYGPAAAAVSTATFGVAAGVGATAELGAIATIMGALSSSSGFQGGGYTGDGSPGDIAGAAHRGEFFFSASQTAALGVPFLRRLASGSEDISVSDAGRLATGGDDPSTFVPPTLTHSEGGPYIPSWMQTQPYWGSGSDVVGGNSGLVTTSTGLVYDPGSGLTFTSQNVLGAGGGPPEDFTAPPPPMPSVPPPYVSGDWSAPPPPMPSAAPPSGGGDVGSYSGGGWPGWSALPGAQIGGPDGRNTFGDYFHAGANRPIGPLAASMMFQDFSHFAPGVSRDQWIRQVMGGGVRVGSGLGLGGSGGLGPSGSGVGGGDVHLHAYTDPDAIVQKMAGLKGRQIIFDTVRGSSIDLGIRK